MALPASHPTGALDPDLLARADWRFLLPAPPEGGWRHLLLLGGPDGLAELLRETGFARHVSRARPGPGRAAGPPVDAAAVLADAVLAGGRAAGEAARCLAPGGVLFCELRGGAHLSLPAGLVRTGLWAVWPRLPGDRTGARAWVPLDPPAALPWFLNTLYPASTPRKRAVEAALRAVSDPRRAARLLTRGFALTAVAGPRRGAPAWPLGNLNLPAAPGLPVAVRRGEPSPLLLAHGRERVALLPFPAADGSPAAVLKVPRLPRFNFKGETEQEVLRQVRAGLPGDLAACLPQPLGMLRAGGLAIAVESCAHGQSLLRSTGAWGVPARRRIEDLELAASWLSAFHRTAELARGPWSERETESWVAGPLDAFRRLFGTSPAEERLFGLALERAAALAGTPVPTVWQHRDFTPWNLLRDGGRLAVIDWEGARPGPPLADLLHFVTLWHQAARGVFEGADRLPARLAIFRELFLEGAQERYAQAARRALAGYRERLGLDRRVQPVLLVATWAELAVRRVSSPGHGVTLRQDVPEADYVATLAAGAGRLFGGGGLA